VPFVRSPRLANETDEQLDGVKVVQALRLQCDLVLVFSLDESLHVAAQSGVHII